MPTTRQTCKRHAARSKAAAQPRRDKTTGVRVAKPGFRRSEAAKAGSGVTKQRSRTRTLIKSKGKKPTTRREMITEAMMSEAAALAAVAERRGVTVNDMLAGVKVGGI